MKLGFIGLAIIVLIPLVTSAAQPPTLKTLATFNSTNGGAPQGSLLMDPAGNIYGASTGGTVSYGTIFKIAAGSNTVTSLLNFNGNNGTYPNGALIMDSAGDLLGTTLSSGSSGTGEGTVFKIAVGTNILTTLASFTGPNGGYPVSGLCVDSGGNLYGTTSQGGTLGLGTIFEVTAGTNKLNTLFNFNTSNGSSPQAGLIVDSAGNLFGTTVLGGTAGFGTVFEFSQQTKSLSTLVSFGAVPYSGGTPRAGLLEDYAGNLYGTTNASPGTIFEVSAGTKKLTTLATLNPVNGADPFCSLIEDAAGNLYGTARDGGPNGDGSVFELNASTGAVTTLFSFDGSDGERPSASLIADASGNLYGTTSGSVYGGIPPFGTVFELSNVGFVVPEPGSLGLLAGASVLLLQQRRRPVR